MEKILGLLGVILALIFVSAVVMTSYQSGERDAKKNVAMFEIAPDQVDHIRIEGPDGAEALLVRAGDGWILPDLGDFPADARMVNDALARLLKLKKRQPAGNGEAELIRYKLAGDDFERRITFAKGDQALATLYIGTPLGPRQVHARRADEDTAYDVDFGLYDAPAAVAEWIDKGVLQLPLEDIAAIEVNGLRLVPGHDEAGAGGSGKSAAPTWALAGDAAEGKLKPSGAARLADLLAQLRIEGMLGDETDPDYGLDTPVLTLTLTRKDGRTIDYSLGKSDLKAQFTLKVSSWPAHFLLSSNTARQLIEAAGRAALLEPEPAQHAAAASN